MIELSVPDMSCGHCVASITSAAKAVDAAAGVEIDLPARRVRIRSAEQASRFVAAIAEAGYTPTVAK